MCVAEDTSLDVVHPNTDWCNIAGKASDMHVEVSLDYTVATRRTEAHSFTTRNGRNVPQIILQGNWVEQWGFEIGCSVSVECYQDKLVVLKD